jgi:hypothetical protein
VKFYTPLLLASCTGSILAWKKLYTPQHIKSRGPRLVWIGKKQEEEWKWPRSSGSSCVSCSHLQSQSSCHHCSCKKIVVRFQRLQQFEANWYKLIHIADLCSTTQPDFRCDLTQIDSKALNLMQWHTQTYDLTQTAATHSSHYIINHGMHIWTK